jgi:hypothetical protein
MSGQTTTPLEWKPVFAVDYLHPCALHGEDEGWYQTDEAIPCCPDCGRMLDVEECPWCGANWLKYGDSWDDIIADAVITESGDLVCAQCYQWEEEEKDDEDEYGDDWEDDYP